MSGCARCSTCGIHYPPSKRVCEVDGCGERLSFFSTVEPDTNWLDQVRGLNAALAQAKAPPADDELRAHRVGRFEAIGFPDYAAQLLADAKDARGFPLWWGTVQDVLARGATHSQALRIYV